MSKRHWALALCLCVALAAVACGQGGEEATAQAGSAEEWAWLQQTKEQLDAKRQELADVRAQLRAAEGGGEAATPAAGAGATTEEGAAPAEPAEPTATAEDLAARQQQIETEVNSLSEEFGGRLVGYINSLEIVQGEPLTPEQQQAMRMKSEEDIELAREWIEKGGDYRRAIEIYESALLWDPDNEELRTALAEAESMRYMTEERFAQVAKGMSQEQVRSLLGPVNLHNIREYPEKNAVAWFYPKDGGGAAGVYFALDAETGVYEVYQMDYTLAEESEEAPGGGQAGA
jgi:hypothetical protein